MPDILGLVGKKLGKYEITSYLNSGGMSFIYRARQEAFKRDVAIKVTSVADAKQRHDDHTFLEFSKRFSREAEVVSRLNHPHIMKVFDYGEDLGYLYLVMELHTGGSLGSLLQQGRLSLAQTSKIIQELAEALDYAHHHGVIHRDIKPQNVLLDEQGNAILTDFGIAKVVDETTLTRPGSAVGTPTYMSPEQWQGVPLDGRSDQYSLGVMTYEMLSGTLPFPTDTPFSLMTNHLNTPPPPLHLRCTDIPETVEYVINKTLAKDRAGRYASTKQFAAAFAIAITGVMPSDDPLDTLPPRRSGAVQAVPRPAMPVGGTPLRSAIGHEQDATLRLETEEIEQQRMRTISAPRSTWLTIGTASIVLVSAIMLMLAARGSFSMGAQVPTETPTQVSTATLMPTETSAPTATITSEPTATTVPLSLPNYLGVMFSKDFETENLDEIETNGWKIEADTENENNHLFCIATGTSEWAQFNLIDSMPWADYSVEFRAAILRFDEGNHNAGNLQISLRIQERPENGEPSSYYAGLNALKHNTFLQKWTPEKQVDFSDGESVINTNQWYDVRVEMQDYWMRLFVDGALSQQASDTSFSSGAIGIQAAPSSSVCIDDLVVRNLHRTTTAQRKGKFGKLADAQDLLYKADSTTVIGRLKKGVEVMILEESADKQQVYVRDDSTGLQGWLPASAITAIS